VHISENGKVCLLSLAARKGNVLLYRLYTSRKGNVLLYRLYTSRPAQTLLLELGI
jgi:hypothetical protein